MHLDSHGAAGANRALASDATSTGIAHKVTASDVGDGRVGRGETSAGGAVLKRSVTGPGQHQERRLI